MKDLKEIKDLLVNSKYMCLATNGLEENAWAAPMTYVVDEDLNIYFHSALDSRHIENIKENPVVSFAIYDSSLTLGEIDGLQGTAIVGQLEDEKVPEIHEMFFKKHLPVEEIRVKFAPPAAAFLSEQFPQKRFFKMKIDDLYKKDIENMVVSRRLKVELNNLA